MKRITEVDVSYWPDSGRSVRVFYERSHIAAERYKHVAFNIAVKIASWANGRKDGRIIVYANGWTWQAL